MNSDDPLQLAATVTHELGVDARTLVRSPSSTVEPPRDWHRGRRALEVLERLSFDPAALEDLGPLGEGGMGVVHAARQVALDRTVAVKFLRPDKRAPSDVEALLAEAWRTGGLEHPNILPVHALHLDADGRPLLVMKRIEGQTWAQLLHEPALLEALAPGKPPLGEHLRILQQVCNAVHFAHSRGVLHRDLKPENVMVGRFGEVYLVDWGIAVEPGPSTTLAGTPAYLAPEMLGSPHATLSERTDVYLLGAVLCEVLSGRAPHRGATPNELFASVLRSNPELPADAPDELVALVRRCMQPKPEDRPASALEVRLALEAFTQHEGSLSLAAQSDVRAGELVTELAKPAPDAAKVGRLFSECRFGFQQALASWSGNSRAVAGLDRVLRAMIDFELRHGAARVAASLLQDLPVPDAALRERVEAAVKLETGKDAQLAQLQALAVKHDPETGSAARMALALGVGVVWIVAQWVNTRLVVDVRGEQLGGGVIAGVMALGLIIVLGRVPALQAALNRQVVRTLIFALLTQAVVLCGLLAAGVFIGTQLNLLLMAYWFVIAGSVAASVLPAIAPSAVGYLVSAVLVGAFPQYRHPLSMLGNLVFCVNAAVYFRRTARVARPGQP